MRQRCERFCTVPNIATEHSESLRIGFGFLDLAGLAYAENEKLGSLAARFCCVYSASPVGARHHSGSSLLFPCQSTLDLY